MPELRFHPEIVSEVKASYFWYQEHVNGLGDDFMDELESAYQTISQLPRTWPLFQGRFRRFMLSSIPIFCDLQRTRKFNLCCCCHA